MGAIQLSAFTAQELTSESAKRFGSLSSPSLSFYHDCSQDRRLRRRRPDRVLAAASEYDKAPVCDAVTPRTLTVALYDPVCIGHVFGPSQRVELRLLDISIAQEALEGVKMELQDCAFNLVDSTSGSSICCAWPEC